MKNHGTIYTNLYTVLLPLLNCPKRYIYEFVKDMFIVKLEDLAKLTGKSIEELRRELSQSDCISVNLNGKR